MGQNSRKRGQRGPRKGLSELANAIKNLGFPIIAAFGIRVTLCIMYADLG